MSTKLIAGSLLLLSVLFIGAVFANEQAKDCCSLKLACCNPKSACCVADAKLGCCDKGLKCCTENKGCCAAVQKCCTEGLACCKEAKACCGPTKTAATKVAACCSTKLPAKQESKVADKAESCCTKKLACCADQSACCVADAKLGCCEQGPKGPTAARKRNVLRPVEQEGVMTLDAVR
jgi:hypothetical protein